MFLLGVKTRARPEVMQYARDSAPRCAVHTFSTHSEAITKTFTLVQASLALNTLTASSTMSLDSREPGIVQEPLL